MNLRIGFVMHKNTERSLNSQKKPINNVTHPNNVDSPETSTLKVTVEYMGYIKQTLKAEQAEPVTLSANSTVGDLLILLAEKHGDPFKKAIFDPKETEMKPHHILAVNGILTNQLGDLKAKLNDGDLVVIMPVVTGG